MAKKLTLLALYFFLILPTAFTRVVDKINFPEFINTQGKKLVLNGVGIRKANWFKVNVYYGGLYLTKKSKSKEEILKSKKTKHIMMHFVRDVDKDALVKGWQEAFNNRDEQKPIQKEIKNFLSIMDAVKKGEKIEITFQEEQVIIKFQGKLTTIKSSVFSKELFSVWFINPIDEGLLKGFLHH